MLPVVPLKQSPGYCGPTSLQMVLEFYKQRCTEEELARLAKATRKLGCDPEDLVRAARNLGFDAHFFSGCDLEDLDHLVNREETPVIVDWVPPIGDHYSVVIGVGTRTITIADPYYGRAKRLSHDFFLGRWKGYYRDPPEKPADIFHRGMIVVRPS